MRMSNVRDGSNTHHGDTQLNSQPYLDYAYEKPLLTEAQEKELCSLMEGKLTHFICHFADHPMLLDFLKDFILTTELDASRASIKYLGRQDPHALNILGTIDQLETLYHVRCDKRIGHLTQRLKSKISRWRPPSHTIAKAFLADDSSLENLPPNLSKKLSRLKRSYFRNRNAMIQSNLRLVLSVASKYKNLGTPYDDLVQEGNMGLIKAIEHFDVSKGYRFSTYAYRIISQNVHLAVDKNSSLVRRPFKMMRDKKVVEKIRSQLEQQIGRQPRLEDVKRALPEKVDSLPDMLRYSSAISANTLPETIAEEGYAPEVEDTNKTPLLNMVHISGSLTLIEQALSTRPEREQLILKMKYGIGLRKEYTLEEIGEYFGLSRERVRQIYIKSVEQIKDSVHGLH